MPERTPVGLVRLVRVDGIFGRVEALGQNAETLHPADIVLVGTEARHAVPSGLLLSRLGRPDGLEDGSGSRDLWRRERRRRADRPWPCTTRTRPPLWPAGPEESSTSPDSERLYRFQQYRGRLSISGGLPSWTIRFRRLLFLGDPSSQMGDRTVARQATFLDDRADGFSQRDLRSVHGVRNRVLQAVDTRRTSPRKPRSIRSTAAPGRVPARVSFTS